MAFYNLIRAHPEGDTEFCRHLPCQACSKHNMLLCKVYFQSINPCKHWRVKVCVSLASGIHDNRTYSRIFSIWETRKITHSFFSRDHMMNNWICSKLKHLFYTSQYHFCFLTCIWLFKNQTKQRKERERKVGKKNRRKEGREKERKSAWFWFKIFAMTFSFSFFFFTRL